MMKKSILLLAAVLCTAISLAQAPNKMSYQSVIRNASGALLSNQAIAVRVSILESSATGISAYTETHSVTTNDNGLASFEIGTGSVISGSLASVNWGSDTYFLRTDTDPNGGNNYSISGTQQLLSVPYAMHAKTASTLAGGSQWITSGNNIYSANSGNVGIGEANPGYRLSVNGSARISGGNVAMAVSTDNSLGNVGIGPGVYNDTKLNIETNQDFGVYIAAPFSSQYSLYVNGEAAKPGGSSWTVASDKNLKRDVSTYSDGLSLVMSIKPVKFKYTKESGYNSEIEYVGVLAQDLQEVAPYMVSSFNNRSDGKDYLSVDNHAMTYMLINAVKEQQSTIEELQQQLEEMRLLIQQMQETNNK